MKVNEVEYKGYEIKIYIDEFNEDPREWDNLGTMICFHKRYNLGDKNDLNSEDFEGWDDLESYIQKEYDASVILPLYMYDHSGITIRTYPFSCRWDSGQIGFIYVSKEDVRKEFEVKRISKKIRDKVERILLSEVNIYDQYVRGDVYGYIINDPITEEHVDSCWGFFGYDWNENGLLEYAKPAIDYYIKSIEKEIAEARTLEIGG